MFVVTNVKLKRLFAVLLCVQTMSVTQRDIRSIDDKAHTLLATSHKGAMANGMTLVDNGNFRIRRLTPTECARLQTVPEWYIWDGISDTQRYKMLGNGWNIETIKHIFKYLRR